MLQSPFEWMRPFRKPSKINYKEDFDLEIGDDERFAVIKRAVG